VVLLVIALVVAATWGLARRPAGARTSRPRVEQAWLLGVGAALYGLALLLDGSVANLVMAASLVALLAGAAANRHLTGVVVMAAGLLLNLTALVLNNGMPVRPGALEHAGVIEPGEVPDLSGPRHLETASDQFGVLGDALPIAATGEVLSFGDLIIILGAADAARELSRRRSRRWSEADRAAYRSDIVQASAAQDWGAAPSRWAVSGSQYSEKPDTDAPAIIDLDSERRTSGRRELVAASHRR
jgi:Family of unknown function (DUF5317)